ncbi:small redox-active disulfide protein 2 [Halomonas ventosae]|uniref:Small redox-active disulfide protein 2 n=1 Tax=Halomonas ventosae TaxID=229007 RepID=A0A2T0VNR3_9GAMM|nr:small redox-active disulfide protein 2 [Halomonas ventosae]
MVGIFLLIYFLPAGTARFDNAVLEGIRLTHCYAQEHVILCLLPAFLIAGAMAAYLSQGAVMHYLGPAAPKPVAFGMASVSRMLLAVCSCTVLPLFGGIYRRGAGLGLTVEIEKVTDMNAIIDKGVMRTPALGVDGEVIVEGKVASAEEIQRLLKA